MDSVFRFKDLARVLLGHGPGQGQGRGIAFSVFEATPHVASEQAGSSRTTVRRLSRRDALGQTLRTSVFRTHEVETP